MRRIHLVAAFVTAFVLLSSGAQAQKVEVAPGVSITRKTYPVPHAEAPFYNFAERTAAERNFDQRLVEEVLKAVPDRGKAAREASDRGWQFVRTGNFALAARRFNQAFLLDPRDSALYQGFAAVVASRFGDFDFADELFELAARMNAPYKTLNADRGRVLLMAGRPAQAKPILERAVQENPESAVPKTNLAWATLQTGDRVGACRLAGEVSGVDLAAVARELSLLKQQANCP